MIASRLLRTTTRICVRCFSTTKKVNKHKKHFKVAVAGASGGIGQPLALLLKQCPMISELRLYDINHTPGVAADLSHIETPAKVTGHQCEDQMCDAFCDTDIIVVPAGMPRKPGMTRDDLFGSNAAIIRDIAIGAAKYAPKAMFLVITNPVNSTLPIASEVFKNCGVYDAQRIFGVSTLDTVRANTFVAELKCLNPMDVRVPVIGGHAGTSIIPLFSRCKPKLDFTEKELVMLTEKVQNAGTVVVKAKAGAGSATLAMAYAGARFTISLMCGMSGEKNVIESAFVASDCQKGVDYFATPLRLGPCGVEENLGMGKLSDYEKCQVQEAIPQLQATAKKGCEFVNCPKDKD